MAKQPTLTQKLAAELIGTALLVLIGAGSVTATFALEKGTKAPFSEADLGVISLAFAFIIAALVYTIGKVSGCHINPAVTISLALTKRQPWNEALMYIGAQVVGGIVGAFAIVLLFGPRLFDANSGVALPVTAFSDPTNAIQAAAVEALGTFILALTIYGVAVDGRAPAGWAGLIIGLIVAGIVFVLGPVTNGSLNPARSFGPALVQTLFGGKTVDWGQFWVYVVGPIAGAAIGAFTYDFLARPKEAAAAAETAPAEAHEQVTAS